MSDLQNFLDNNLGYLFNSNSYDNSDIELEIGRTIKKKRLEKNMSQIELSRLTSITQSNISKIEKGKVNITIAQLKRIATALKLKIRISMEE
ncbi:MAG: helix-turn-helix transcriptional regulator [Acholeplasmatales bacterium]|nr:helix-turn-helix transcriptional regulator [Acholeplasmatales bacterium]